MKIQSDDTTELIIAIPASSAPEAASTTTLILRRAFRHGLRARNQFPGTRFADAEAELRAAWLLNGEAARWPDVRDTVRLGFEEEPELDG